MRQVFFYTGYRVTDAVLATSHAKAVEKFKNHERTNAEWRTVSLEHLSQTFGIDGLKVSIESFFQSLAKETGDDSYLEHLEYFDMDSESLKHFEAAMCAFLSDACLTY